MNEERYRLDRARTALDADAGTPGVQSHYDLPPRDSGAFAEEYERGYAHGLNEARLKWVILSAVVSAVVTVAVMAWALPR